MRVIIAGGRNIVKREPVRQAIVESGFKITELVTGRAAGADMHGEYWAKENKIPMKVFLPDWVEYGSSAGPIRNQKMAEYAEALILVWDGKSRGSANMLENAKKKGLKIYEKVVK